MKDFNLRKYLGDNKLVKESVNESKENFADLRNKAKKIKGFKDFGHKKLGFNKIPLGFSIPYEYGNIEIIPKIERNMRSPITNIEINWISPGNEDSQISPLSVGYKVVDNAIRSSMDDLEETQSLYDKVIGNHFEKEESPSLDYEREMVHKVIRQAREDMMMNKRILTREYIDEIIDRLEDLKMSDF